jgi:hypothetical protein
LQVRSGARHSLSLSLSLSLSAFHSCRRCCAHTALGGSAALVSSLRRPRCRPRSSSAETALAVERARLSPGPEPRQPHVSLAPSRPQSRTRRSAARPHHGRTRRGSSATVPSSSETPREREREESRACMCTHVHPLRLARTKPESGRGDEEPRNYGDIEGPAGGDIVSAEQAEKRDSRSSGEFRDLFSSSNFLLFSLFFFASSCTLPPSLFPAFLRASIAFPFPPLAHDSTTGTFHVFLFLFSFRVRRTLSRLRSSAFFSSFLLFFFFLLSHAPIALGDSSSLSLSLLLARSLTFTRAPATTTTHVGTCTRLISRRLLAASYASTLAAVAR